MGMNLRESTHSFVRNHPVVTIHPTSRCKLGGEKAGSPTATIVACEILGLVRLPAICYYFVLQFPWRLHVTQCFHHDHQANKSALALQAPERVDSQQLAV